MSSRFLFFVMAMAARAAFASEPDWSTGAFVSAGGRANPYLLPDPEFSATIRTGELHALHYPVRVTGILLPLEPARAFLEKPSTNPLKNILRTVARGVDRLRSFDDLEAWLGLHPYPKREEGERPYRFPLREGGVPSHRMGTTVFEMHGGKAFTIGCAECHVGTLFGRSVFGMTNRFPRANAFFASGLKMAPLVLPSVFGWSTDATPGERDLYARSREAMRFVGAKAPVQLGLDTSLAQVALSLAKRARTPWAERDARLRPREEILERVAADSKPAVWWNVKYKNRWLADGSVVSGNPIFTNLLWNELGRGTDLRVLSDWLDANQGVIRELTTAVFASTAPRWTDFFPADSFDLESARRGEKVYLDRCAHCHGVYEKGWSRPEASSLSAAEKLATTRVSYRASTPAIDVGTDPLRARGMRSLVALNDLEISKRNGISIVPQNGYVPPPLVGIWARWPYFHNNSAPSLCAVLSRSSERPKTYWAREARAAATDFDADCNGYPAGRPTGASNEAFYDTRREGLGNGGHDEGILADGSGSGAEAKEWLSAGEKRDLIRFLQTL